MTDQVKSRILRPLIAVLALADGVLHFALDFILFRGNFFGSPFPPARPPTAAPGRAGPPPGARPLALPLPLNELFLLNFVGEVVLVLLFLFVRDRLGANRWWVNVIMIGYVAVTFVAWWLFGRPNPMGLGYLSKGIEIVLIIVLSVDLWGILRPARIAQRAA